MASINPRDIRGITLLSIEEAKKVHEKLRSLEENGHVHWWWLRTPGYIQHSAACVRDDGSLYDHGIDVSNKNLCIRPALRIRNHLFSGLKKLDEIEIFDCAWTVITDDLILCDNVLGNMAFRKDSDTPDANDYERSDIKIWLENWLEEQPEIKTYRAEQRALHARVEAMWRD